MANRVICIGRQNGAGGHIIGEALAKKLGIAFYDKNLITLAAERSGLSPELIEHGEERKTNAFLYNALGEAATITIDSVPHTDVTFAMQRDLIIEAARTHDCVIIGRCADYILREQNPFRIFVYADMESRVRRCMERRTDGETQTEKQMIKQIRAMDKNRARYYEFYTGLKWGDKFNYDLCINTSDTVIKEIVPAIAKMLG